MKKVLQVLTFLRGPNRWVLKSPQHLEQIPALLATFPDATFAITHRDPVSVIQSAIDDARVRRPHAPRRRSNPKRSPSTGSTASTGCCGRACATATCCPADRSVDVLFHEFMADDVGMVERIYERNDRRR